ncbi:MAG TPA: alpha/beta hydrolase [Gemmatimonadaceae bacterium]|nr:alpha/beta hydrolase [Gemmatimonadaceae bacterium]
MPPFTDPPVDADLLRIPVGPGAVHVERYGHGGEPIVLLHGFPTSSFVWRLVAPTLAAAGYTAYAVDLFGYGESDRPFDADFGIAAQAEYIDRALTALRISEATVVGLDFGGAVGIRLAATRPERVERLVLVNSLGFEAVPARDIRLLQRNTARFALRINRSILGVAPMLTPVLEGSVASLVHMPDRLVARYLAPFVGREGITHLLTLARAVVAEELDEVDLAALAPPTLVVAGESDQWVDRTVAERLAETIPGARLVTVPGTARLIPEEAPDELARLILDFVAPRRDAAPEPALETTAERSPSELV